MCCDGVRCVFSGSPSIYLCIQQAQKSLLDSFARRSLMQFYCACCRYEFPPESQRCNSLRSCSAQIPMHQRGFYFAPVPKNPERQNFPVHIASQPLESKRVRRHALLHQSFFISSLWLMLPSHDFSVVVAFGSKMKEEIPNVPATSENPSAL